VIFILGGRTRAD